MAHTFYTLKEVNKLKKCKTTSDVRDLAEKIDRPYGGLYAKWKKLQQQEQPAVQIFPAEAKIEPKSEDNKLVFAIKSIQIEDNQLIITY